MCASLVIIELQLLAIIVSMIMVVLSPWRLSFAAFLLVIIPPLLVRLLRLVLLVLLVSLASLLPLPFVARVSRAL